jgi:hypothetical protein
MESHEGLWDSVNAIREGIIGKTLNGIIESIRLK